MYKHILLIVTVCFSFLKIENHKQELSVFPPVPSDGTKVIQSS